MEYFLNLPYEKLFGTHFYGALDMTMFSDLESGFQQDLDSLENHIHFQLWKCHGIFENYEISWKNIGGEQKYPLNSKTRQHKF